MPSWINRTVLSGASVDENATLSHTCTFTPAMSGNFLVAVVSGSVTCTTPSGWTLAVSSVNNAAVYVFTKVASASESSFSTTHPLANYAIMGVVYEFPAGTTYQAGASAFGMTGTATGPVVSGLTGTYARFTARTWCMSQVGSTSTTAWILPTTLEYDSYVPLVTNDGVALSIAYDDNQTGSSFTPDSTTSNTNTAPAFGEGVAFALNVQAPIPGVHLMNNAAGGTNGANVTYYNSGETSGDPWDYINIGAGAAITFSNQNARGGMSYRFSTTATSTQAFFEWQKLATPLSTMFVRFNVFLPAYPAASTRLCELNDGTNSLLKIGIRSDGILSIRDSSDTSMITTTVPLPVGRWARVEFQGVSSPTNGQIILRTYREVDSPYPTERVTSAASFNTQPGASGFMRIRLGITGINIANTTYYMDDIAVSSADFPGPADAGALAPLLMRNSAETGTNGATISSTNTGDSVNASINIVRGPDPIIFSNAQTAHGALSYRFQPTTGNENFVVWSRAATSAAAMRVYANFAALPASLEEFAQLTTTDSGTFAALCRFVLTPANKLRLLDAADTILWTSTASIATNTWYRFEAFAQLGGTATTGTISAEFYALDSTTAIESFSTSTANLGTTNIGFLRVGKVASASAWNSTFYIDDVAMQQQASGFIGPYTAPSAPPSAYPGIIPQKGWGRPI